VQPHRRTSFSPPTCGTSGRTEPPAADDIWWELIDAAAPPDRPPTGVVRTRADALGVVHIVALGIADPADVELLVRLLRELLAALRRTDTVAVSIPAVSIRAATLCAVSICAGHPAAAAAALVDTLAAEGFRFVVDL
jgi:hypothetical protein